MIYLAYRTYHGTVQNGDHIYIPSIDSIFGEESFNAFRYVIFHQSHKSGLAELIGEYKNADRVSLLDGRVIRV